MTFPPDTQSQDVVPRRWRSLDDEQRQVADELVRRALVLREASDGELSIRGAVELAADAVQRRGLAASNDAPAKAVPDGR